MTIAYLHSATTPLMLQVKADLDRHEGFREYAYPDPLSPLGKKYVGKQWPWGFVPARQIMADIKGAQDKDGTPWTVGFGFTNATTPDSRIGRVPAERMLEMLILNQNRRLEEKLEGYKDSSFVTKSVLINMAFNMGLAGLQGFKNTLAYIRTKQYAKAATNMELSLWYVQVGKRARELVQRIRTQTIAPEHLVKDTCGK